MNLSELVCLYLEVGLFRQATEAAYQEKVRALIREVGDIEITHVKARHLTRWRDRMIEEGLSIETWNNRRRHLSSLFRWAVKNGKLPASPFDEVAQGPQQRRRKKTIDAKTLNASIRYIDDLESQQANSFLPYAFWRCVIYTFYWTGIRRSQLVALRWQHIDFERNTILLCAEASKTHREHLIPIATKLLPHLKQLHERAWYQWQAGNGTDSRFQRSQVFNLELARDGTLKSESLVASQVSSAFARIASRLNIKFSPHRLRHTLATNLVHANVDLVHIKDMLGHSDLKTTAGYIEPSIERLKTAVDSVPHP